MALMKEITIEELYLLLGEKDALLYRVSQANDQLIARVNALVVDNQAMRTEILKLESDNKNLERKILVLLGLEVRDARELERTNNK